MTRHVNVLHDSRNQCQSVRFEAPLNYNLPKLDLLDIHFHLNPKDIDGDDAVVFQRPSSHDTFEMIREAYSSFHAPVLIELDDALYDVSIFEDDKARREALRINAGLRDVLTHHCDGIVVSTEHIANGLHEFTKKPICIMPNAVNPNYAPTEHSKTILYAGAGERNVDFNKEWIDAIEGMKSKGYKFVSTTNLGIEDEHLGVVQFGDHCNRLRAIAPEYYIAPLRDSELNRGRSNLKEIEAASIGAKFLGGIGVKPDFTKAKVPTLHPSQDYTSGEYLANFIQVYAGLWLMDDKHVKEWKAETKLGGGK